MSEIAIDVQDRKGHVRTLNTPSQMHLERIAELARDALGLPLQDVHGRSLRYVFFHSEAGRFLNPTVTVQGYDLHPGDRLRIYPQPFGTFFELEIISDGDRGLLYPLFGKETSIGRDTSNDITISNKAVSRQHGVFEWQDGFHIYVDLGSANGSWLNDQPVTSPTPIADGDVLSLGQRVRLLYRERIKASDPTAAQIQHVADESPEAVVQTGLVQIPRSEVFLSYSPGQREVVEGLEALLGKTGVKLLYDQEDPEAAMRRSEVMVAILSREAVESPLRQAEWQVYESLRKPVIPIIFEPCRMPPLMQNAPVKVEYRYNDRDLARDVLDALHTVVTSSL